MSQNTEQEAKTFPCEECGGMVDLGQVITVRMVEPGDPVGVYTKMSEYEARVLLDDLSIPRPPVLCDKHESREIITEAMPRA